MTSRLTNKWDIEGLQAKNMCINRINYGYCLVVGGCRMFSCLLVYGPKKNKKISFNREFRRSQDTKTNPHAFCSKWVSNIN